ncbi:hypothetical protein MKX03_019743, partial [Papaver bracteatum]
YGTSIEKEKTLTMIKPDDVSGSYKETINKMILDSNFSILRETTMQLFFYAENSEKIFLNNLITYMTSVYHGFGKGGCNC